MKQEEAFKEQTWKSSAQPLYAKVSLSKPGWNAKKGCPNALNLKKTEEISYTSTAGNDNDLWAQHNHDRENEISYKTLICKLKV